MCYISVMQNCVQQIGVQRKQLAIFHVVVVVGGGGGGGGGVAGGVVVVGGGGVVVVVVVVGWLCLRQLPYSFFCTLNQTGDLFQVAKVAKKLSERILKELFLLVLLCVCVCVCACACGCGCVCVCVLYVFCVLSLSLPTGRLETGEI